MIGIWYAKAYNLPHQHKNTIFFNMIGIIGAVVGDIVGSFHEFPFDKEKHIPYDFELVTEKSSVTDDTIHTCAVADWLMNSDRSSQELVTRLVDWTKMFWKAGYGGMFRQWCSGVNNYQPYNSFGNGSAMRVSPVAWVAETEEECIDLARRSAEVTHNHPEGIKGAIATAVAIFHNRKGKDKEYIKNRIIELTGYDLNRSYDSIKYDHFDATCQGTVPEAIICWLESNSYEDCVRKAVCLGCDTDTQAAIAGSICAANSETQVPDDLLLKTIEYGCYKDNLIVDTINRFNEKYIYNV